MNIIKLAIICFCIIEIVNVIALYFFPNTKKVNGMGVFKTWERSKQDPEMHDLVKYLVNWVAGTKLIFIMLMMVIVFTGDEQALSFTGAALIISISSFYWRLFPLIRKMDREDLIDPKNYSSVLGWLILSFIIVFFISICV